MKAKLLYILTLINIVCTSVYFFSFRTPTEESSVIDFQNKILKVHGLVVVDSLGIERVIIGSSLPTAQSSFGNRLYPREKGSGVSGLMLYDSEGQERGGYVTDDDYGNIFLTLDSKSNQTFIAVAEPNGSTGIQLYDRTGKNKISLSTTEDKANIEIKSNDKNILIYEKE
ncbi:hypothetical protein [Flavobacterium sp.]|uniref:hypothetical protein n=1 Tax=Flavobacterium sp. TaxID=239 RepID=UPI002FDA68D6